MFRTYVYSRSDCICQISRCSAGAGVGSGEVGRRFHFGGAVPACARYSFFHRIPYKDVFQFVGCRRVLSVGVKGGFDAAYRHSCYESAQLGCHTGVAACAQCESGVATTVFYVSAHGQTILGLGIVQCNCFLQEVGFIQDA